MAPKGNPKTARSPARLNPAHRLFCLTWLANGFNATAAYKASHPGASTATAMTNGCQLLRNTQVKAFLDRELEKAWTARQMSADEVLMRVALDARADLRTLYDAKGKMLPIAEWPDDLANSIEAVEFDEDQHVHKVKLTSKGMARRTILEVHGRLKPQGAGGSVEELIGLLARHYKDDPNG